MSNTPKFFSSAMAKLAALLPVMQHGIKEEIELLKATPFIENSRRRAHKHSGVASAKRAAKKARNVQRAKRR